jgi:prolyl-tRNA synthetase
MAKNERTAIEPTREEDYPLWYQQVIKAADLAENSEVRGCMVIKPNGYAIWENIQRTLDGMFKETGHKNAYFPLFIPKSYFEKEAKHVEGFAKECAVVTHSRLEDDGCGGLKPGGLLTEELIIRPTSETIIGESFSKWVKSYRDLPLLINQWANIVRWEMRTRLFLRTSEFLWQEGHTVHASEADALEETLKILDIYCNFTQTYLAIPVIKGKKTESEKFPGAVDTYTFEAMMQDKKSLQAGTSHFLGQNFAKASNIKFQSKEGREELAWTTSWGVTTRLIGALIMAHSDDNGMVIPPRIAPIQVAIIPIYKDDQEKQDVLDFIREINQELKSVRYHDQRLNVEIDQRDLTGSERSWDWIKKGVPIRLEIGPRDLKTKSVFLGRRDRNPKDKVSMSSADFVQNVCSVLDDIQNAIYQKALIFRDQNIKRIDQKEDFYQFFTPQNKDKPEIHGGFASCHWCTGKDCEEAIKQDLTVSIRCIPLDAEPEKGQCIYCQKPSSRRVIFAKSY